VRGPPRERGQQEHVELPGRLVDLHRAARVFAPRDTERVESRVVHRIESTRSFDDVNEWLPTRYAKTVQGTVLVMGAQARLPSFLDALPLARGAAEYAWALHEGQRRESDEAPFILHPFEVAFLLANARYPDAAVATGVLHEALEDGGADAIDLLARFGPEVAGIVRALSEDPAIESFAARKAELRRRIDEFGGWALAVDAADKVAKVRELRMRAHDDRRLLTAQEGQLKLEHYWATLEMLEARDAARSLTRQLRFELEMLGLLPPSGVVTAKPARPK
jgi:hypothetical protein